jgi:hypothetical protein
VFAGVLVSTAGIPVLLRLLRIDLRQ